MRTQVWFASGVKSRRCFDAGYLLDAVYHSALRFISGDGFSTHHCLIYQNDGWTFLALRREQHCILFIYKALLKKMPVYLTSLLNYKSYHYGTRTSDFLVLNIPFVRA